MANATNVQTGTYVIRNVHFPGKCISVKGSSDANKGWLALENFSEKDSNYTYVENRGSGNYRMFMPSSGKQVNIALDTGCRWPSSLWACQMNGGRDWNLNEVGTVSYGGQTYPKYRITTQDTGLTRMMEPVNTGVNSPSYKYDSTGNMWMITEYEEYQSDYNEFFLVPANPALDGVYEVACLNATHERIAIEGASTSNGAYALLAPREDANYQKVMVSTANGQTKLEMVHSGKLLETKGVLVAVRGKWIQQWTDLDTPDQKWVLLPDGMTTVNGCPYAVYKIANVSAQSQTILLSMNCDTKYSDDWLWQDRAGDVPAATQRFAFIPTEAIDTSLATPATVGILVNNVFTSGKPVEAGPARGRFTCAGTDFECRYRYRSGVVNSNGISYSGWTAWMGAYDGVAAYEGWGEAWKPNLTFASSASVKTTGVLDLPEVDDISKVVQVEMQVRAFSNYYKGKPNSPSHGNSASSGIATLMIRPTITLGVPLLTREGLRVSYTANWPAGGCTFTVNSLTMVPSGMTGGIEIARYVKVTGQSGLAGSMLIGWEKMVAIPEEGQDFVVAGMLDNGYLPSNTDIKRTPVTFDERHTLDIDADVVESDHATYVLTPDAGRFARVFLKIGDDIMEVDPLKDGTFDMFVPLNTPCDVTVIEWDTDGNWGMRTYHMPGIRSFTYVWTFGDGDWAVLNLGIDKGPVQESKRKRDYEVYTTTSRQFPATRFHDTYTRDMSVSGAIIEEFPRHGTLEAFERLLQAGHAVFRNPRGEVVTVAVTGYSDPYEREEMTSITVEQHQETI